MEARCVAVEYHAFPTVEWVVHLKNQGTNDTPLLSSVRSLDTVVINHIDQLMTEEGIDIYRQDQFAPLLAPWRSNDAPDRQGITEIRHVEGYLRFWDELRNRHPNMFIDTCAGGGARIDLETLRRAVPLHSSDYNFEPTGKQGHTYGLAFWLPYFGHMNNGENAYHFRSIMTPAINTSWDLRRTNANYELKRTLTRQWRTFAPNYLGDYYPLLGYSSEDDAWMAWQFDRPEVGEGMVQVFRRPDSPFAEANLKLRGLNPKASYAFTDIDTGERYTHAGADLMENGLAINIPNKPTAKVFTYTRAPTP